MFQQKVPLPVDESIPLLPGQAWLLTAPDQLFSNRITEILSVSLYLAPRGYTVDVLYRHWTLPQAVTSPLPRTIVSSVSPRNCITALSTTPLGSWPSSDPRATLVLSSGTPHRTGRPPPLATLDSLPDVVEVHRVVPFLPPGHIGRPTHAPPGFKPPDRFLEFPPPSGQGGPFMYTSTALPAFPRCAPFLVPVPFGCPSAS